MSAKVWWKSRALHLNTLAGVLAVAEAKLGIIQPFVPVNVFLLLSIALPIANVILRPMTTQPLSLRPEEAPAADVSTGDDANG